MNDTFLNYRKVVNIRQTTGGGDYSNPHSPIFPYLYEREGRQGDKKDGFEDEHDAQRWVQAQDEEYGGVK